MARNKRKIALIGCGRWGKNILRDLIRLGCEVSVVDINPERLDFAKSQGATNIASDVNSMAAVDGIVIATPTSVHAQSIREVMERNVPIFCEKPLTHSAQKALEIVTTCPSPLFLMDKWRYHPAIDVLAQIAKNQKYGKVIGLSTERKQWGIPHKDVDPIWILAPHDISIALHIFGSIPKPKSAVADYHDNRPAGLSGF